MSIFVPLALTALGGLIFRRSTAAAATSSEPFPAWLMPDAEEDDLSPFGPPPPIIQPGTTAMPPSPPPTARPVPNITPAAAAAMLATFLRQNPSAYGSKLRASASVATFQRLVGIPETGMVDAATRKAAAAVGTQLPYPPSSAPAPAPAPAPARVPSTTPSAAVQAANLLRQYLISRRTDASAFGLKGRPSQPVAGFQQAAGITVDGIIGPQTYAAAERLGVPLPPRPTAAVQASAPAPAPVQVPTTPAPSELKRAANLLNMYLRQAKALAAFGTRAQPSEPVRRYQRKAGITADGIVGPQTYASAKAQGVYLPARPGPAEVTYQSQMTPGQRKAQEANRAALKRAASLLRMFLIREGVQKKNPRVFGAKGQPSKPVQGFQGAAKITQDGIVGPQTRAAAKSVGVTLPDKPKAAGTPTQAAAMDLKQMALILRQYLVSNRNNPAAWGLKGKPSAPVANFQRAAGITQDGIYGPQTKAAGERVGVPMPAR